MLNTKQITLTVLIVLSLLQVPGCSSVEPEPPVNTMLAIELDAGDQVIYHNDAYPSMTFEGPATLEFTWLDGTLSIASASGAVQVRPLKEFQHMSMTEPMIDLARSQYTNVPRIDELLEGNPAPSKYEWTLAYEQWLSEITAMELDIQLQYVDQTKVDYTAVAQALMEQMENNELVVPGMSQVMIPLDSDVSARDINWVMKGALINDDGQPDKRRLLLRTNFAEPTLPDRISWDEALELHHRIYLFVESSSQPVLIDLSAGEIYLSGGE